MPPCSTCGRYNSSCTVLCTRLLNRLHNLAVLVEQLHNVTLTYPLAPGCPPLPSCTRSPLHHTTLTPHFQLASPHWEHPNLNNTVVIVEYWVMLSEYRVCVQHTGVLSCWKHNNDWALSLSQRLARHGNLRILETGGAECRFINGSPFEYSLMNHTLDWYFASQKVILHLLKINVDVQ